MTLQHHSLVQEFPEFRDAIHRLKVGDPTFRTLFEEYDEFDKRIYRIEQDIEPVCDEFSAQLKRRRLYAQGPSAADSAPRGEYRPRRHRAGIAAGGAYRDAQRLQLTRRRLSSSVY
jgi:uncharacterized protein YdcH (DUF465 family)